MHLNTTPERILIVARNLFKDPPPIKKNDAGQDKNEYYEFYRDYGHLTSECYNLKKHIETLIRDGEFKDFMLKMVGTSQGPTPQQQQNIGRDDTVITITNKTNLGLGPTYGTRMYIVHTTFGGRDRRHYMPNEPICESWL